MKHGACPCPTSPPLTLYIYLSRSPSSPDDTRCLPVSHTLLSSTNCPVPPSSPDDTRCLPVSHTLLPSTNCPVPPSSPDDTRCLPVSHTLYNFLSRSPVLSRWHTVPASVPYHPLLPSTSTCPFASVSAWSIMSNESASLIFSPKFTITCRNSAAL